MRGPLLTAAVAAVAAAWTVLLVSTFAGGVGEAWRWGPTVAAVGVGAVCLVLGLRQGKAWWFDGALGASAAALWLAAPSVHDWTSTLVLLGLGAAALSAHALLILSMRAHSGAGPVLNHALPRIAVTAALGVLATLLLTALPPLTGRWVSERWTQSFDVTSTQLLGGLALAYLGLGTGLTLLRLARSPEAPAAAPTARASVDAEESS